MIIFSIISLFSFFICFFVGGFVYFQSSKRPIHKLFFVLCLLNAFFALSEFLYRQAGEAEMALFWAKTTFLSASVVSVAIHLIIEFSGKTKILKKRGFLVLLYGPVMLLTLCGLSTDWIISGMVKASWGYDVVPGSSLFMVRFYEIYLMFMGQLSIVLSFIYYLSLKPGKKKKQAKYIVLGCLSPSMLALITVGFLPAMGFKIPLLITLGTAFQEILIGYAIWKFDLFDLNPITVAENIVSTMSDLLILITPKKTIAYVNDAVLGATGYDKKSLLTKDVSDILPGLGLQNFFNEKKILDETQKDIPLPSNCDVKNSEGILVTKDGREIPVSTSISILKEKDKTFAGYVLVARDVAEREKLILDLKEAVDNIKTLKGLIPICASCKKIRDDKGYWNILESYIQQHSDVSFSHSMCPECSEKFYGKEQWYIKRKKKKNLE